MSECGTFAVRKLNFLLRLKSTSWGVFRGVLWSAAISSLSACFPSSISTPLLVSPSPSPSVSQANLTPYPLAGPPLSSSTEVDLTSISPASGGQGITLELSGSNFLPGATVMIGTMDCPAIVKSTFVITCIVPASIFGSGPFDVTVTNPDLTSTTLPVAFSYNPTPTITSISPAGGASGTQVTITGTEFDTTAGSVTTVSIGDSDCTDVIVVTDTTITCETTEHLPGSADVVVNNPDTQQAILSSGFTYTFLSGQIALGHDHTCAIVNGGVKCWGLNSSGQLGNSTNSGTATNNNTPLDVSGLTSGVESIAGGYSHTCALMAGQVWCWGQNANGQLGNNTAVSSVTPVRVVCNDDAGSPCDSDGNLINVQAISAGVDFTCAVADGNVWCWGDNRYGQLGDNTNSGATPGTNSLIPVEVTDSTPTTVQDVKALSSGAYHSCVLASGGSIYCWGRNDFGQLGNSTTTPHTYAVQADGGSLFYQGIAAGGFHTCAIRNGAARCWGQNLFGQLGTTTNECTGTANTSPLDVQSPGDSGIQSITAGEFHTCVTISGSAECWGLTQNGRLGNMTTNACGNTASDIPILALTNTGITSIVAGGSHTCVVNATGMSCFGLNQYGELGNATQAGTATANSSALLVDGSTTVGTPLFSLNKAITSLGLGFGHACITIAGSLQCWGANAYGQVGDGTLIDRSTPKDVSNLGSGTGIMAVQGGTYHSCALIGQGANAGKVTCWGDNTYGQLGDGTNTSHTSPSTLVTLAGAAQAIAVGNYHACALVNGGVKCWGRNFFGQLGNSSSTDSNAPVSVTGLTSGVQAISAGAFHTCALQGGTPYCWGYNSSGQLGSSTNPNYSLIPIAVPVAGGTAYAEAITTGSYHSCAIVNGGAQCWGYNGFGQLGNGADTSPTPLVVMKACTPVAPSTSCTPTETLVGVTQIVAGFNHTCALASGVVQCWGYNHNGQLGNNSTTNQFGAAPMLNTLGISSQTGAQLISAGGYFSCAQINGQIQCTGLNANGELGQGTTTSSQIPVPVIGF